MPHDYEINPPIGIDLGTSNSVISHYANTSRARGAFVYQLNTYGGVRDKTLMPSCVFLQKDEEDEELLVGVGAENKWKVDPLSYAKAIKRYIGETEKTITLGQNSYSPTDLSRELLKALMTDPVKQTPNWCPPGIVITVPYYFKQHQINNTLLALEEAVAECFHSFEVADRPKVLSPMPEPVACAIAYLDRVTNKGTINDRVVLVFDLGGGTLDVTTFKLTIGGEKLQFEILATAGDAAFGGEDFDQIIVDYMLEQEEVDLNTSSERRARFLEYDLLSTAREAKEKLSFGMEVELIVNNLPDGGNIDTTLARSEFESLLSGRNKASRNFGRELNDILDKAMASAKLNPAEIDLVLCIGGSSQIPYFTKILQGKFSKAQFETDQESIKYAVAKGAALYAGHLLDTLYGHHHKSLAKGIAYETAEIKFRTAHRLGIEKQQGRVSTLIPANSAVPARKQKSFVPTAYLDPEKTMIKLDTIRVFQGSSEYQADNTQIGEINIPAVYSHGRSLREIKIKVDFEALETALVARVNIPEATKSKNDIDLELKIEMTHD